MIARWRVRILAVTAGLMTLMPGCSLAPKNFKGIQNPAPLVRARAIPLGRGLPDSVVVPSLIERLNDKDQVVRLSASEELKKRTNQDFGFVPYAESNERAVAVAQWRSWWAAQPHPLQRRGRKKPILPSPQDSTILAREGPP